MPNPRLPQDPQDKDPQDLTGAPGAMPETETASLRTGPGRGWARSLADRWTQYAGGLTVALLAFSGGMGLGWTSGASSVEHGGQGFPMTSEEWSWVGSAYTIGAVLGCLPVGGLLQALGRRVLGLLLAPVLLVGWALHVWADAVWMLYLGRTLVGVATGASGIIVPIYASEIAESAIRGAVGSFFELLLVCGVLAVYLLGGYASLFWLNMSCLIVPVVFAVAFVFMPDTPRWLLTRGRLEDARKSLIFFRSNDYDVDAELHALQAALEEAEDEPTLVAAFSTKAARRGLVLSVGAMAFQQFSGIDAVTFYASQIFRDAGTSLDADSSSMVLAAAQIVATFLAVMVVDDLGRRILLIASSGIMAVCCFVLGTYLFLNRKGSGVDVSSLSWLPVLVATVYMFTFSIGLGPVPWIIVGEIFPDQVKGIASSIANMVNWMCAFLVTKMFTTVSEQFGDYLSFWIFGAWCVASLVFVVTSLPETKGKTLDEIQFELQGKAKGEVTPSRVGSGSPEKECGYGAFVVTTKL